MQQIDETQWSILGSLIGDCCAQLFESCQQPIQAARPADLVGASFGEMAAFIGFTGQQIAGCVLLTAPRSLVIATHPTQSTREDYLSDWLGELVNMLVGRLKHKLLDYGAAISLSTPTTLTGQQLSSGDSGPSRGPVLAFTAAGQIFAVSLNATMADGARLIYAPNVNEFHSAEGEVELF